MSLFDGKPIETATQTKKVVLCASRMTDMPKFYPKELMEEVNTRIEKGWEIHTLVLLTKHPRSLLAEPLKSYLLGLRAKKVQLFIYLTITGLGGLVVGKKVNGKPLILEPKVPPFKDSLMVLPDLVNLAGNPERLRVRIDPIVRISDSEGKYFSNLNYMPIIIKESLRVGIKNFHFSLLEKDVYQKVEKRFTKIGCKIIASTSEERKKLNDWLKNLAEKFQVNIYACSVSGIKESKCVDARVLQALHDEKWLVDDKETRTRERCGCTRSIDLGGWPPKPCFSGCDYCYANSSYID